MKRPVAAAIALAFFMLVLLAQAGNSTAQVTPFATPTAATLNRSG